jgi:aminoglycoside phosphotransferase (APT) family kinase protein
MSETLIRQEPEAIISRVRPDHQSIQWLQGGDNRDVIVVDGREAFRFPKDESGVEVGRYEFAVLELLQGKLSVAIPEPIELAADGSYNVLSFLPGKVLSKKAVTELPFEKRRALGSAIGNALTELNTTVSPDDLRSIPSSRSLKRIRDDYYAGVYETALHQEGQYEEMYRDNYERIQQIRPHGSADNIIVFGDFSSPNLVLSDDDLLTGMIDWTELGFGDIHNELRPVFSVIGQPAFDEMVAILEPTFGIINKDLVRLNAIGHELAVLVSGKQKGELTPERSQLALDSVNQWLR